MYMRARTVIAGLVAFCATTATAFGQGVLDGSLDVDMPDHSALQGIATNFGNNDFGQPGFCNGSELNAVHITKRDGFVVIFLAGNLESNYNKLDLFVDARDGGQNQLAHDNPDVDFNGLNRMGNSNENATDGLKFDEGFEPDIWITVTCGDDGNGGFVTYGTFSELRTTASEGTGFYLGSGSSGSDVINGENGIQIAIDNSNIDGVGSGIGSSCGDDVNTGIEIAIPEFAIDWNFEGFPIDNVKVMAFINGNGHDFISNQVIPGIPPSDNLGEPRGIDFGLIPGIQYASLDDLVTDCPSYAYGACCLGEICTFTDQENCELGGGDYQGDDSFCDESTCAAPDCATDVNSDGKTDVDDLLELLSEFGEICN